MTKTVCDVSGTSHANNYKITRQDGKVELSIDLCEGCAKKVTDYIRGLQKVTDVQPVMDKQDDKQDDKKIEDKPIDA